MSSADSANFVDYYEVLGVAPASEFEEIRRAYILKAKEHHPDTGGSIEMMRQLNTAYKTLKDSTSKAAYDMLHSFHMGTTHPNDYSYSDGRKVSGVNDMADDEIDSFLDSLLSEYRHGVPKSKLTFRQWLKQYL